MDNVAQDPVESARRPPIVEHFAIEGLFGYRTVSLSSKYAATVLIAKNGSGKTTLLAALDAFLRGQFTRFAGLVFERMVCHLQGEHEPLVLLQADVERLVDLAGNSEVAQRAKAWDVEPLALLELLEGGISDAPFSELRENPTFYSIYSKLGYDYQVAKAQCGRLASSIFATSGHVEDTRSTLRQKFAGVDIVYLPTYRRIELSLPSPDARRGDRRKSVLARLGVARSGLYTADIQFGLGDISDRLQALNSEMLYRSNQGYGKISANVINDLISGEYRAGGKNPRTPPTRESIELFFARIKDAERELRTNRFGSFFAAPDLDRVYSGDVPADAKEFLTYFLDQLNSVIQETRDTESLVEAFISSCNKYLSGQDESIDRLSPNPSIQDDKRLDFNRRNLSVTVTSSATGDEVPLEALSSGEKQMISLFARLYLYPGKKLLLIDEPELSLSLDWQRKILPDVLQAPNCIQVIAITHSPFIFDNVLEPFASSLRLSLQPKEVGQKSLLPGEGLDASGGG